jgi:hypothetical protein
LKDAKEKQAAATDSVADAIDRETDALERYKDMQIEVARIVTKYPKITAKNPMAGAANTIPATVSGNSTGFKSNPSGSGMVVNVNAGLISSPATVSQEIVDLLTDYSRLNGSINFGGGGFGLR